ncbi:putative quinol monooxygenase [Pantoea agglomerans]|uniref:putative quinol monooxygenase n=1 Tax=Enterobacter agglomerans TaxID=549 RepID=UPI00320B77D2
MLYLVFSGKIKENKVTEFYEKVAKVSQNATLQQDKPVVYQWHKNVHDPRLFFLNEQWKSVEDLHAHFETLYKIFGAAKPTERLPAAILEYLDEASVAYYDPVS